MTDASIPEMTFTMLSLLFLLLGVVLIASIIMSTINPYEQIVFANTEKLRASMDQVCSTGQSTTINFDLPQSTPKFTSVLPIMPIWMITTSGDPNYVLYYESFPPGEAIGWEVYQKMQNRLIVSLPKNYEGENYDEVKKYVSDVVEKAKQKNIGLLDGVVVDNIILNNEYRMDFYLGEKQATASTDLSDIEGQTRTNLNKFGKWVDEDEKTGEPSDGDNFFKFNNYAGLSTFAKSSIKYIPCGENSLCLKTRDGVHRFPLNQCNDIKAVQIVYDARNRATIYGGAGIAAGITIGCVFSGGVVCAIAGGASRFVGWLGKTLLGIGWSVSKTLTLGAVGSGVTVGAYEAGEWLLGAMLSYKTQDFAIASPCSIKEMTITEAKCKDAVPLDWATDQKACADDKVVKIPLYKFDSSGVLRDAGDRYICGEKANKEKDTLPASSYDKDDKCLQVKITEKADDFCWTPDPFKDTLWSDTQLLAYELDFTPIYKSLSYINPDEASGAPNYVFLLKEYDLQASWANWKDFVGRRIAWGWPG